MFEFPQDTKGFGFDKSAQSQRKFFNICVDPPVFIMQELTLANVSYPQHLRLSLRKPEDKTPMRLL